jgi:hypothetical protein
MLQKYVSILSGAQGLARKAADQRLRPKGLKARPKETSSALSRTHKAPVEMEEKEPKAKDSIQYILERLSEILPQDVNADGDDTSFASAPMEIDAAPEEGGRLIRAFIRIKHPELRDAIIKLATRMANAKTLK